MGLLNKLRKKVSDAFSFEDEAEGAQQKQGSPEAAKPGAPKLLSDKQILAALTDYLRKEGNVITVGDTTLAPRYFTIYLGREDYRHWMGIEVVRDTLVRYLRDQLAKLLTEIQGADKPLGAGDVHVAIKADDNLTLGQTEIRASIDREAGFAEIVPAGGEPVAAPRKEEKPEPAAMGKPSEEKGAPARPPKPPPKPKAAAVPLAPGPERPSMETRVVEPTEAAPAQPALKVELVVEDADSRERYALPELPVTVGRYTEGGVDIADESQHLSRKHLEFSQGEAGGLRVRVHENARNPTSVDGVALAPGDATDLQDGSEIVVADLRITVHVGKS